MSDNPPAIGLTAPGLIWRRRKDEWVAVWLCRTDISEKGFEPRSVPLWHGVELPDEKRQHISDECNRLQAEMLAFNHQGYMKADPFDGTITGLCEAYQTDKGSNFPRLRYSTRRFYTTLMQRLIKDHGEEDLRDIRAREALIWHQKFVEESGVAMAHALVGMMRTLFGFGATYLESKECERLCGIMHRMKFPQAPARSTIISAEQATAIRKIARKGGLRSMAYAQAFQFDCTFRQKDCIGEWVPIAEPGVSDTTLRGMKWLRGIRWEEIDQNMILRHTTSKRQKDIEIDLKLAPMVVEELTADFGAFDRSLMPASGPIIVHEVTMRPWVYETFRGQWRKFANQVGIPKTVKNMDTRAGAISEATDAGIPLESIRHAATHSNTSTTERYSRSAAGKVANVMTLRAEFRNKK